MVYMVAKARDAAKLIALSISDLGAASEATSHYRGHAWAQASNAPDATSLTVAEKQGELVVGACISVE